MEVRERDSIDDVISSGLVASKSPLVSQSTAETIDVKEEPLVLESYRHAIIDNFNMTWLDILCRSAGGLDPSSKGLMLERVVAHVLAFRHIEWCRKYCKDGSTTLDTYRLLSVVLEQLECVPHPLPVLEGWSSRAYRVVEVSHLIVPFE